MLNNSVMINHSLTMHQKTIFRNYFLFRHKKVGEIKSIFYLFSRAEICVFFKHVDGYTIPGNAGPYCSMVEP